MKYKRLAYAYVWCDRHGEIHQAVKHPYSEDEPCDDHWRRVYVETDDREEAFE